MSNDLISRKSLIKNLNRFAPEHYSVLINDLIQKEPVAYDVDAVCEEMGKRAERANKQSGRCYGNGKYSEAFLNDLEFNTIIQDIDIARNGGKKK